MLKLLKKISLFIFVISLIAFLGAIIDTISIGTTNKENSTYSFTYEDFQSNIGEKNKQTNSILAKNQKGSFVYGPYFEIENGIYDVTIFYSIPKDSKVLLKVNSNHYTYGAFDVDEYFLSPEKNEFTFELNIYKDIDDLEFVLSNMVNIETDDELSFYGIDLIENKKTNSLLSLYSLFIIFFSGIAYLFFSLNSNNQKIMLSIFGISIGASLVITMPYLIMGHDILFHLLRIEGLSLELLNGVFPVKMQTHWLNGAGYPVSTFYGETLLYIPAFLRICGITVTNSYRIYVFVVNLLTTMSMFFVCFKLSKNNYIVSIIGTMAYVFFPYRLCCLYLRTAVGEFSAMIFIPLIAYAFIYLFKEDVKKEKYMLNGIIPLSIGVMGLIQTHILSLEMCGLFCVLTCLVFIKRTTRIKTFFSLFIGTLIGVLSSLWFLIPFLDLSRDGRDVFIGQVASKRIQMHGLFFPQLFQLFFKGNGSSKVIAAGIANEMPLGIGIASLAIFFVTIAIVVKMKSKNNGLSIVLIIFSVISSIMTLAIFPWDSISSLSGGFATIVSSIQFPWRFLTLTNIFIPLAFVSIEYDLLKTEEDKNKYFYKIILSTLICLNCISSIQFQTNILKDNETVYKPISTTGLPTNAGGGWEYLLENSDLSYIESNVEPNIKNGKINDWYRVNGKTYVNASNIKNGATILFPILYDKYWEVKNIETNEILEKIFDKGLIAVNVPNENDYIKLVVSYKQPYIWTLSYIVNIIVVLIYSLFIFISYYISTYSFRSFLDRKKAEKRSLKYEKQKEKEKKEKDKKAKKQKKEEYLKKKNTNIGLVGQLNADVDLKMIEIDKFEHETLEDISFQINKIEDINDLVDISKY